MRSRKDQTKTELVVNTLREDILHGQFPNGNLPSKLELAEHFKVSHRTIDCALKLLRTEGLIRGVRGTGIFINQKMSDVSNLTHRLILMVLPKDTFHESEPYSSLRAEVFRNGLFPINLSLLSGPEEETTLFERASLTQLLRSPIRGVVYSGRSYWRAPFLDSWKNLRSVGLVHFDAEGEAPGSTVLIDFESGGYKMARHMIERGCKKLLVFFSRISADVPKSADYWRRHPSHCMLRGAERAAAEAGIRPPELFYQSKTTFPPRLIEPEEFRHVKAYDGILCGSDGLAYSVIKIAEQSGMKVPEDLMVSGILNTVWSSLFDCQISTIDQNPAELSRHVVRILEEGGRQSVTIEPDLILRNSTER